MLTGALSGLAPPASSGTDATIAALRAREFSRLDRRGLAYLDYTGAALHAERQLQRHHRRMRDEVFGNPHSESAPSQASTEAIERARHAVLDFFAADPGMYAVVFTANTTAAIKLVAESYPFGRYSALLLATDNHNSVNGIREYARRARSSIEYLPLDDELRLVNPVARLSTARRRGARLLAFPAQSNFSGVQHPLTLIEEAQRYDFDVLLDAAAFVPSNVLSMRDHQPQFVTVSFYKMFGYPTGIGALIARKDALARLRRPWFAGGTVEFASVQNGIHQLRSAPGCFEDGTPDFLAIPAIADGLELLTEIGMPRIHAHVARLTSALLTGLLAIRHDDGSPAVAVYGPRDGWMRGGAVAFNLLDRSGRAIPYARLEHRARLADIAIRGGCFCNPGAAESAFGFDAARARSCMNAARDGFTIEKFAECLGDATPVGALRASVGLANTDEDVARLVRLIRQESGSTEATSGR